MTSTTLRDPLDDSAGPATKPWPEIPIPAHILKGPADADAFRTTVGRSRTRWYMDPLPADEKWPACADDEHWPAISTVKKAVGQDWTLVGLKRVADATVGNTSRFEGMDMTELYGRLRLDNEVGLDRASKRGTNVHTYFEKGLRGQPITFAEHEHEHGAEYLPAVRAFFHAYEPELVCAETVAIHRDLNAGAVPGCDLKGYGGTLDAIMSIKHPKTGKRVVVYCDWKSRKDEGTHTAYPQEAAQVGAAAHAQYMLVESPVGVVRMEMPKAELGIIVSIRPDGCRVYPIDLDEAFRHWTALHRWWMERKLERNSIGRVWPAAALPPLTKRLEDCTSRGEAVQLWKIYKDDPEWTAAMTASLAQRFPKP